LKEDFIVRNRTLVKVSAGENCIGFKTISRKRKSGREYLITRTTLARLEAEQEIITSDIHSFAVLRRNIYDGTVRIDFSWLRGGCDDQLTGWEETVTLPYDELVAFVRDSAQEDGPKKWKVLSVQKTMMPRIVVHDLDRLRQCLENRIVRGKLARALRDNFWGAERVILYHDFEAYSFMFQSFRNGRPAIVGGLILHGREDLKKAYYSVHT